MVAGREGEIKTVAVPLLGAVQRYDRDELGFNQSDEPREEKPDEN